MPVHTTAPIISTILSSVVYILSPNHTQIIHGTLLAQVRTVPAGKSQQRTWTPIHSYHRIADRDPASRRTQSCIAIVSCITPVMYIIYHSREHLSRYQMSRRCPQMDDKSDRMWPWHKKRVDKQTDRVHTKPYRKTVSNNIQSHKPTPYKKVYTSIWRSPTDTTVYFCIHIKLYYINHLLLL